MTQRLIVLDFDGTMTDAEAEGVPFREGYLEDVAALCGADVDEVRGLADGFEAHVRARVGEYGWIFGGRIVAPATVDPYLRIMPVARMVFDHYGRFRDPQDRDNMLDAILYKYNYPKTRTVFRPGARELLASLEGSATYVVTNSHTKPVQGKIRALGDDGAGGCALDWLVERVHGRARKYHVDEDFDAVPASIELPGLSRPVLLRRRLYHEALSALLAAEGVGWPELTVVGDIFELDLCLPLAMGAQVILMAGPFTPGYERDYLNAHPRAAVVESLGEVKGLLG